MLLPPAISLALNTIDRTLGGAGLHWLVGGSCGLLLQQVPLGGPPRDLDIYMDEEQARRFDERLRSFSVDRLQCSETDIYRSLLGHYHLQGVQVELVGGFRVRRDASVYEVRIADQLLRHAPQAIAGTATIRLMPLAHELVFNVMRQRPDRFEAIARAMRSDLYRHLPALREIMRGNALDAALVGHLSRLLGISLEERNDGHVPGDSVSS